MSEHTIARYVDAEISAVDCTFGTITQDQPLVHGDCNILRLHLSDTPPDDALIYVQFINSASHSSYGDFYRNLTDGMEITIPNNEGLFFKASCIKIAFTIEADGCKKSSPTAEEISTVPLSRCPQYVGETGVKLISDVYEAGEAAQAAAEKANKAAEDLINGGGSGNDGFSPTVSISKTDGGHKVTITDVNGTQEMDVLDGKDGADGTNGTNGADGKDGYTPIKGTDYYTEADKEEMIQEIFSRVVNGNEVAY